jgi:hypothetical protein
MSPPATLLKGTPLRSVSLRDDFAALVPLDRGLASWESLRLRNGSRQKTSTRNPFPS